jgi:hypothetical protein
LNLPEGKYSALAAYLPSGTLCNPTKVSTVRRLVTVHRHGRTRRVRRSIQQRIPAPLLMPTSITAQNGAVLTQATKIAVTGCSKPKHATRVTKRKTAAKGRKGRGS